VNELCEKLSSAELTEWLAFYELEPWGNPIESKRHAIIGSTIANVGLMISNPKQLRFRPFVPDQFELKIESNRGKYFKDQTWEEQKRIMAIVAQKANKWH